jgi:hypothetical protein
MTLAGRSPLGDYFRRKSALGDEVWEESVEEAFAHAAERTDEHYAAQLAAAREGHGEIAAEVLRWTATRVSSEARIRGDLDERTVHVVLTFLMRLADEATS